MVFSWQFQFKPILLPADKLVHVMGISERYTIVVVHQESISLPYIYIYSFSRLLKSNAVVGEFAIDF